MTNPSKLQLAELDDRPEPQESGISSKYAEYCEQQFSTQENTIEHPLSLIVPSNKPKGFEPEGNIIFIDDDVQIRNAVFRILRKQLRAVLLYDDSKELIINCSDYPANSLIISDYDLYSSKASEIVLGTQIAEITFEARKALNIPFVLTSSMPPENIANLDNLQKTGIINDFVPKSQLLSSSNSLLSFVSNHFESVKAKLSNK